MKTKILILLQVLIISLVVVGLALANGSVDLPRWVLGSGGSDSSAGNVTLQGTLGQPIVGDKSGGNITLEQGFWHGSSNLQDIYLPLILK